MENQRKLLPVSRTTYVSYDENLNNDIVPGHFFIHNATTDSPLTAIRFQKGPVKENGINGVSDEDLLTIVKTRLEFFQKSKYNCDETEDALKFVETALGYLKLRTLKREKRGVEGTNVI